MILAITGAITDSSREKLYQELGLESLQQRRWFRQLCCFSKITKNQSTKYLFDKIPSLRQHIEQKIILRTLLASISSIFLKSFFPTSVIV